MKKYKIAYVVSDLKRVGPSNQTLNIIKNSKYKNDSLVITLFSEPIDTMIDEYRKEKIDLECLNLNRITFMLKGKKILGNRLSKYNIQLVHSYGVKADCLCQKVCNRLNIKHVITLRNYPKEDILTRMNFIKGRIALHNHLKTLLRCDNVICCSKSICDMMKNDYPSRIFSYVQNGVDVEKYKPVSKNEKKKLRNKYGFGDSIKIYITAGSFIPRKKIEETISGFIMSKNTGVLLLLGDGILWNELHDKYCDMGNIIFLGKKDKITDYLQLSDVFISSSESEGLPNSVLEAIACGLPVILSDIPQHKEIIQELPNAGKCYELGNIDELANKINKVNIVNKSNLENSPFTMKKMSKKYTEYYEGILENE